MLYDYFIHCYIQVSTLLHSGSTYSYSMTNFGYIHPTHSSPCICIQNPVQYTTHYDYLYSVQLHVVNFQKHAFGPAGLSLNI